MTYTIDDLDFLSQVITSEHDTLGRFEAAGFLADASDDDRCDCVWPEEWHARCDEAGIKPHIRSSEWPRIWAECSLARGDDERTLRALARSEYLETRVDVAQNPVTPPDALRYLAEIPFARTVQEACSNPNLGVEDLERFAHGTGELASMQRDGVGRNPRTPARLLWEFACSPDAGLRGLAAVHRNAPAELLAGAVRDPDETTRAIVAFRSRRLSLDQVGQLATDPSVMVRAAIARHPLIALLPTATLATDQDTDVRRTVAGNAAITPEIAALLVDDPEMRVQETLAGNKSTPAHVLDRLSRTTRAWPVRDAVARNTSTSVETLTRLATKAKARYLRDNAQSTLDYINKQRCQS